MVESYQKLNRVIKLVRNEMPEFAGYLVDAKPLGSNSMGYLITGPNLPASSITFTGFDVEHLDDDALAEVVVECLEMDVNPNGGLPFFQPHRMLWALSPDEEKDFDALSRQVEAFYVAIVNRDETTLHGALRFMDYLVAYGEYAKAPTEESEESVTQLHAAWIAALLTWYDENSDLSPK